MDFEEKHNYLFDHLTVLPYSTGFRSSFWTVCVNVDPITEQIYVGKQFNEYLHVIIISESEKIVNLFTQESLCSPLGIAIHQDNLYITLSTKPYLVHFKVADDLHLIRSKKDIGSGLANFEQFRKIAVSINGDVFVTDFDRHRVQILDGDLHYKRRISHYSMINPCDIKLTADEVFVLSLNPLHSRYCILVFDQMGSLLRSIVPHELSERGLYFHSLENPFPYPAFCLDSNGNFIISDVKTNEIKFFTKEGTIFQKHGKSGFDPGMFNTISGMALTANHRLVVVSMFGDFELQIFYCI